MSITARQILESVPRRFRPEKAQGISSAFHFIINGEENFELTVLISDSKCTIADGLNGTPACVISTDSETYIGLETGKTNPQLALMTGKIKVSDIPEMMKFSKCFQKFDEQFINGLPDINEIINQQSEIKESVHWRESRSLISHACYLALWPL